MNVSYKKWMLSSLIITLTSYLSCGPNEPIVQPGPVEITATGKYTVRRTDGTLVFEREIDDLCEVLGRIAQNGGDDEPSYTELQVRILCYDDEEKKKAYSGTIYDWRNPPIDALEGVFYFLGVTAPDDVYRRGSKFVFKKESAFFYDSLDLAKKCDPNQMVTRHVFFGVNYEIYKENHACIGECVFPLKVSNRGDNECYEISADIVLIVDGMTYK
jgi:hypothetical protein